MAHKLSQVSLGVRINSIETDSSQRARVEDTLIHMVLNQCSGRFLGIIG